MKRLAITLALSLLATPALATPEYVLPTLFDVTGVAEDDVLNIRERPSAAAPIIGTLAPGATHIEVVAERLGWARVNWGERSGWVSMHYLTYRTDVWESGALPPGFTCFGTEPFWSVRPQADTLRLSRPDAGDQDMPVRAVLDHGWFRDPTRVIVAQGATLLATPAICSDGMSENLFGLRAEMVLDGATPSLLSGCCAIQP